MKVKNTVLLVFIIIITTMLLYSCAFLNAGRETCSAHVDADGNLLCDVCGASLPFVCPGHVDKNHDGACDSTGCNEELEIRHTDSDHNGYCDGEECGQRVKIKHTDSDSDSYCDGCGAELSPLPEPPATGECDECVDENEDFVCDVCGSQIEKERISLIADRKANFVIVIASEYANGDVMYVVNTLISSLRDRGISVRDAVLENNPVAISECEVLIGNVESRGEKYQMDAHLLGSKGYSIRMVEGKVILTSGSEGGMPALVRAFGRDILGLDGTGGKLGDVTVSDYDDIVEIQSDYKVNRITLLGEDIRDYVIAADSEGEGAVAAKELRRLLYEKTGYWLEITERCEGEGVISVSLTEKTGAEGYSATFKKGRMEFVCEYQTAISAEILRFFKLKLGSAEGTLDFSESDSYVKNVRDVFYNDFGAKGDGETDDLLAIIAAHEYANAGGHNVVANPGSTYYIGNNNGLNHYKGAIIKTNTTWTGAKFIIDDSGISRNALSGGTYARLCEIFSIRASKSAVTIYPDRISVSSLSRDSTNIGYAPGQAVLVHIKNANQKNYIRYGANANSGAAEQEIVLVDKDGNIDPSTPLMWNYEEITSYTVYYIDEEPITVTGGEFTTVYNREECVYESFSRGIWVRRSNVTVKDVEHTNVGEGDTGRPSGGFTIFRGCYNVLFENIVYDNMKSFYEEKNGGMVLMGSYEIAGQLAVNVTWKNCTQRDFFRDEEKRYAASGGIMGTNYTKNLSFIGCRLSSFDAHAGVWNVTIKDSEIEHINCIGGGVARIENTRIHTMHQKNAIMLRGDYGSLWMGDFYFIDCTLITENSHEVALFDASWENHDFGFDFGTMMPTNVYVENLTIDSEIGLCTVKLVEQNVGRTSTSSEKAVWKYPVWEGVVDGVENINPYKIAQMWTVKDTNGYYYVMPPLFTTELILEKE